VPYAPALRKDLAVLFRKHESRVLRVGASPLEPKTFLEQLGGLGVERPVRGPEESWVSATHVGGDTIVSVIPSRHLGHVEGGVEYGGMHIDVPRAGGLVEVRFRHGEAPTIISPGDTRG
jgi:hypothetical protein